MDGCTGGIAAFVISLSAICQEGRRSRLFSKRQNPWRRHADNWELLCFWMEGHPLANVYYSSPYVITISALQCSRKLAVIVFGWSLKGREAWHEACRDNQLAWAFNNDQLPFVDLLGSFATETGNHSSQSIVAAQPIQSVNSIRTIKSTCLYN